MPNPIPAPPPLATATRPGLVSIVSQQFAGDKTFLNKVLLNSDSNNVVNLFQVGSVITGGTLGALANVYALNPQDFGAGLSARSLNDDLTNGCTFQSAIYGESIVSASGSMDGVVGGSFFADNSGSATLNTVTGLESNVAFSGSGSVSKLIGLKIYSPSAGSGTITNGYGLFIDAWNGITTTSTNYAIKYNHATKPFVVLASGFVGIGTDTPTEVLNVSGNILATGTIIGSNISGSITGTNTGDVTLAAFGSSPNNNAASLSGQVLTLQPADATHPGGVSTTTQTFAGAKTFANTSTWIGTGNQIVLTGSTLSNGGTESWLSLTGTLPASPTANVTGVNYSVTSAGSAAFIQQAMSVSLGAGYTGTRTTTAFSASNTAAGNAIQNLVGLVGNIGSEGQSHATVSAATNWGVLGEAQNGAISIGVGAIAKVDKNSATNIGVMGLARNAGTSPTEIGGFFGLFQSSDPTFVSAALVADNGSSTSSIFIARDNGSTVFTIADGGAVTATNTINSSVASGSNAFTILQGARQTWDGGTGAKYFSSDGTTLTLTGLALAATNLSGTNTGDVTLAAFGSSPNANGASLSGQALTLQPASGTQPGGVSTTTQTFAGDKTFTGATTLNVASTSSKSLTIKEIASQTGNVLEFQDSSAAAYLTWGPQQTTNTGTSGVVTVNWTPTYNIGNGNRTQLHLNPTFDPPNGTDNNSHVAQKNEVYLGKLDKTSTVNLGGASQLAMNTQVFKLTSGTTNGIISQWADIFIENSGTVTEAVGFKARIGSGVLGLASVLVTDAHAFRGGATLHASGGTFTNFYAYRADAPVNTNSSVITNHYGLRLEDASVTGVTNAFGVFQVGASTVNQFAGRIDSTVASGSNSFTQLQGARHTFDGTTGAKYLSSNGTNLALTGLGLTVASTIESTSGGFKFPDTTTQTTAVTVTSATASWTPAATLAAGQYDSTTVSMTVATGYPVIAGFSGTPSGCIVKAEVLSTNTVTVYLWNISSGSVSPSSGTITIKTVT